MKRLLLLLMAVCIVAPVAMAGGPKKKPNAPKRENLNVAGYELWGDVESVVMTYYYPVDNGEWVDTYSITYTFTENGDVALAEFAEMDEIKTVDVYQYVGLEQSAEEEDYSYYEGDVNLNVVTFAEDGAVITKEESGATYVAYYDEMGNATKYMADYGDGNELFTNITYLYDEDRILYEEHIDDNRELPTRKVYEYDKYARPTAIWQYYGDSLEYRFERRYDKRGNCVEFLMYNSAGGVTNRTVSKFDKQGNEIETIQYDGVEDKPSRRLTFEIVYR
jgi:hypothetical protein